MAEQHKQILKAFGLSATQIDALENMTADQLATLKVDDYVTPVKAAFQNQFLNDETFLEGIPEEKTSKAVKKNIEKSQYARFMNEMKDIAKELQIDFADLSADDLKSIKGFYRETFKKGLSKAGNTQAMVELQDKLSQALGEKTTLEAGVDKKVADAVAAEGQKYLTRLEKSAITTKLAGIKGLTVKPDYISDRVLGRVREKYEPVFDVETMSFKLMQKGNTALDVLKSDGSKMAFDEAVMDILKADELWKEPVVVKDKEIKTEKIRVDGDLTKPVIPDYIQRNIDKGVKEEAV